jgi:hypothetical protein
MGPVVTLRLPSNRDQLTRLYGRQLLKNPRNDGPKIVDAIPEADDRDHADADSFYVLLKFDARVVGDEHFESCVDRRSEQDTVAEAKPPLCTHRCRLVAGEFRRQMPWQALINENSHPPS